MLEPCNAKVLRTVLRGLGASNRAWLLGIQAIDGTRTFTPLDSQLCRLLRGPTTHGMLAVLAYMSDNCVRAIEHSGRGQAAVRNRSFVRELRKRLL